MNSANWNLEAHNAEALTDFWKLGAIGAIPAGRSVVREGTIPYLPDALKKRNENRTKFPKEDPEAKCYMLGIPRATYHNMPFQIFQGDRCRSPDGVSVCGNATRDRDEGSPGYSGRCVDGQVQWKMGRRRSGRHNDQPDRRQLAGPRRQSLQQQVACYGALHTARAKPHPVRSDTGRSRDIHGPGPSRCLCIGLWRSNAQLLEHKCVPFADGLLYQDLIKKDSK